MNHNLDIQCALDEADRAFPASKKPQRHRAEAEKRADETEEAFTGLMAELKSRVMFPPNF